MALRLNARARGGDQVLVASDVRIAVETRTLIEGFTNRIERAEVVGLIGPNGSGKSTLLKAIAGLREIDGGELRVGASIDIAYYRQDLEQVPAGKTLFDIIHDLRPLWDRGKVQGHLGRFGFSGDSVRRNADTLSGGERARVALAMLMLSGANFLLLDEPTNHLDVESIEALEDALETFEGTVLLVSHDRALLRSQVERVWSLRGTTISDYPGTFEEWEETEREQEAALARAAAEAQRERQEQGRADARKQERENKADRAARKSLAAAVAAAEAEVARMERSVGELRAVLESPELYATPDGGRRAAEIKKQLDAAEAELEAAMESWHRLVERRG